jgi:ribosomal protein S18 acetylase RimI-like enzyme
VTIEPLRSPHVHSVARLHAQSLTGLLARLGPATLRTYYSGCTQSPHAIALVAVEHGSVRGFVQGAANTASLRRDVAARRPLALAASIAVGVLRQPTTLSALVRSLRRTGTSAYDTTLPELTYLAVAPDQRGTGTGAALVEAFTEALRARGATTVALSVDEDNTTAIRFYERLGFRRTGRYHEFGAWHARYERALTADAGPRS